MQRISLGELIFCFGFRQRLTMKEMVISVLIFNQNLEGSVEERVPVATARDIQEDLGVEEKYKDPEVLAKKERDFDGMVKTIEEKYKDCNLVINGKVYEFWKKQELKN